MDWVCVYFSAISLLTRNVIFNCNSCSRTRWFVCIRMRLEVSRSPRTAFGSMKIGVSDNLRSPTINKRLVLVVDMHDHDMGRVMDRIQPKFKRSPMLCHANEFGGTRLFSFYLCDRTPAPSCPLGDCWKAMTDESNNITLLSFSLLLTLHFVATEGTVDKNSFQAIGSC